MFKGPVSLRAGRGKKSAIIFPFTPTPFLFLIHILLTKHHSAIKRGQYSLERTKDRASSPHPHPMPLIGGRSCSSLLRLLKDGSRSRASLPPTSPFAGPLDVVTLVAAVPPLWDSQGLDHSLGFPAERMPLLPMHSGRREPLWEAAGLRLGWPEGTSVAGFIERNKA